MSLDVPRRDGTTHSILHDTWDKADLKRARSEFRGLGRARKKINAFAPTGTEAVDDVFYVLHKADPRLVPRETMSASFLFNYQVITELLGLPIVHRLREQTVGSLLQAASATVELIPTLEAIFDRLALARKLAEKLADILDTLARAQALVEMDREAVDALLDGLKEERWGSARAAAFQLASAQEAVSMFEEAARDQAAALDAALAEAAPAIAGILTGGVGEISTNVDKSVHTCYAWGTSPGELQRLPAGERMKLAKKLNTPRLKQIADLFGRIHNLSLSVAAEEVDDLHDDIVDLEFGSDLGRVAASEFLLLADPTTELQFLSRFVEHELLQYAIQGTDDTGRGGIIMCIDGSGSMGVGQRDLWAKATMLVLLHRARSQGRQMHVINFGYRKLRHFAFIKPADFTADRILSAAEAFWASGTDFTAPMAKAVELLQDEYHAAGRTRADVVFATDDECWVPDQFMHDYLTEMGVMKARTWGLMVGGEARTDGALWQMSEGRVLTVQDLTSGRDLRPMLAGVH